MTTADPFLAISTCIEGAAAGRDLSDTMEKLVDDLVQVLAVDAVGIIVRSHLGELELLTATSRRTAELEVYQAVTGEGPCVESLSTGTVVAASGDEVTARWPRVAAALTAAGFASVVAFPMLWRDVPVGALNLFSRQHIELTDEFRRLGSSFAAAATMALGQVSSTQRYAGNVVSVLHAQVSIEQAMGVLSLELDADLAEAYDELRRRARHDGTTVAASARTLLAQVPLTPLTRADD